MSKAVFSAAVAAALVKQPVQRGKVFMAAPLMDPQAVPHSCPETGLREEGV
tara:strand:+ start:398 stop:550 length:153 start_codon:yes stop_codon:yes gene_type:complete